MTDEPVRTQAVRMFNHGTEVGGSAIDVPWTHLKFGDTDPISDLVEIGVGADGNLHQVTVCGQLVWDRDYRTHMTTQDQSIIVVDHIGGRPELEIKVMHEIYQMIRSLPAEARGRALEWVTARIKDEANQ